MGTVQTFWITCHIVCGASAAATCGYLLHLPLSFFARPQIRISIAFIKIIILSPALTSPLIVAKVRPRPFSVVAFLCPMPHQLHIHICMYVCACNVLGLPFMSIDNDGTTPAPAPHFQWHATRWLRTGWATVVLSPMEMVTKCNLLQQGTYLKTKRYRKTRFLNAIVKWQWIGIGTMKPNEVMTDNVFFFYHIY